MTAVVVSPAPVDQLDLRAAGLARLISRLELPTGAPVLVATCDPADGAAAARALRLSAHPLVEVNCRLPTETFAAALRDCHPALVLACRHATKSFRDGHCSGRIFGDLVGYPWWRMLEAIEAGSPAAAAGQ